NQRTVGRIDSNSIPGLDQAAEPVRRTLVKRQQQSASMRDPRRFSGLFQEDDLRIIPSESSLGFEQLSAEAQKRIASVLAQRDPKKLEEVIASARSRIKQNIEDRRTYEATTAGRKAAQEEYRKAARYTEALATHSGSLADQVMAFEDLRHAVMGIPGMTEDNALKIVKRHMGQFEKSGAIKPMKPSAMVREGRLPSIVKPKPVKPSSSMNTLIQAADRVPSSQIFEPNAWSDELFDLMFNPARRDDLIRILREDPQFDTYKNTSRVIVAGVGGAAGLTAFAVDQSIQEDGN
ncbi:MAG: hypothetical protein AAFP81_19915, partial [Pseudomonadota bacterium]